MRQNSHASFILHQNEKQNSFFAKVANPFHKFQSIQAVNLFKSIKMRHFVVLAEEINKKKKKSTNKMFMQSQCNRIFLLIKSPVQ